MKLKDVEIHKDLCWTKTKYLLLMTNLIIWCLIKNISFGFYLSIFKISKCHLLIKLSMGLLRRENNWKTINSKISLVTNKKVKWQFWKKKDG